MKKILLIDYYGICDKDGKAIGHSPKVLMEYGDLLKNEYEVSAAVSPCLYRGIKDEFHKKYQLKYDICSENESSIVKRVQDKFKLFSNMKQVLEIDGYDIYWFYRTDFFLFFFLVFVNIRNKKKIVAQIYQASFGQGKLQNILNWFYKKGMSKFDGITYAQKEMNGLHPNMLYFPDYYYDADKYKNFESIKKREKVVCLGTMNPYKRLDELVDAFNLNGYPLEIKGYFYDKRFYQQLCNKIHQNIVIEDRILAEEEYYRALAGAKYTILPYDMEQYQCRTSGVLIESLFLNTIAIAPEQLLWENHIKGIGYNDIEELADSSFFIKKDMPDNSAEKKVFEKEEIRRRLYKFMDSI